MSAITRPMCMARAFLKRPARNCITGARNRSMARACLYRPTREFIIEARDMCMARACRNRPTRDCITGAMNLCTHRSTQQTHPTCLQATPTAHSKVRSRDSHGAESRVSWYYHEEHRQVQLLQAREIARTSGCAGTDGNAYTVIK